MYSGKQSWSIIFLAALLCITISTYSYAAERYMMCTRTDVRVRANPNTKANVITQINKEPMLVIDEKNTGEKFLWYKVSLEDENDSYGWVYGQFLRKMKIKQNYSLDDVNGIAWGTNASQLNGVNLTNKSDIDEGEHPILDTQV